MSSSNTISFFFIRKCYLSMCLNYVQLSWSKLHDVLQIFDMIFLQKLHIYFHKKKFFSDSSNVQTYFTTIASNYQPVLPHRLSPPYIHTHILSLFEFNESRQAHGSRGPQHQQRLGYWLYANPYTVKFQHTFKCLKAQWTNIGGVKIQIKGEWVYAIRWSRILTDRNIATERTSSHVRVYVNQSLYTNNKNFWYVKREIFTDV